MFKKGFAVVYVLVSWIMFLGVFVYCAGFLRNFAVPGSIDSGPAVLLGEALAVNSGLLLLFGLQHSIMARPTFKRWWTQFIPGHLERATYVLLSNLIVVLVFWQWRATDGVLWEIGNSTAQIVLS